MVGEINRIAPLHLLLVSYFSRVSSWPVMMRNDKVFFFP